MTPSRSLPSTLYHARLHLSDQRRLLPCPGLQGQVRKAYPLLSQCHVQLVGSLGPDGEERTRWQYLLSVPVMLLCENSASCVSLGLYPELSTPLPEETMRFSGNLHLDVSLPELSASLAGPELYELRCSARVSMYLSV